MISLGMVDQSGFSIKLESGKLMITNGTRIVMEGTKRNEVCLRWGSYYRFI